VNSILNDTGCEKFLESATLSQCNQRRGIESLVLQAAAARTLGTHNDSRVMMWKWRKISMGNSWNMFSCHFLPIHILLLPNSVLGLEIHPKTAKNFEGEYLEHFVPRFTNPSSPVTKFRFEFRNSVDIK